MLENILVGKSNCLWGKMWGPEEIPYSVLQNCSDVAPHCRTAALPH